MAYPIILPNSAWYKSTKSRSTITEINIVDSYSSTADETWNADVDNSGSIKCYRAGTVLTIAGNGSGKIAMNADSSYLFGNSDEQFTSLTAINGLALFDASEVTTLKNAFDRCIKVTALDVGGWDVSKVESMARTFQACISVPALDLSRWDVSKVKTMYGMFLSADPYGAMALTSIGDVSGWDTSNTEDLCCMFQMCQNLISVDISRFNTELVKSTKWMFTNCWNLTSVGDLSSWNTSNITDMSYMFNNCHSLISVGNLSGWDVANVTTMRNMFCGCTALNSLDVTGWDVANVTTMQHMFCARNEQYSRYKITGLQTWNPSSCTDMGWMFWGCAGIGTIDVSGWDVSKVESFHHWLCKSGATVIGVENFDVSSCRAFNAMLYGTRNTSYDLSGWDVSNAETLSQLFDNCDKLTEIRGLENWDTSKCRDFGEMFHNCKALRELNLAAFDTRNASGSWKDPWNGESGGIAGMFGYVGASSEFTALQKIILGENFSFGGDGSCTPAVLPTPSADYVAGADGMWYNATEEGFAPADVPNYAGATYFAAKKLVNDEVIMRRGTITRIADAIRRVVGDGQEYTTSEMADRLCAIAAAADANREYGVEWDYSQDGTTLTRLGDAALFANPAPAKTYDTVGASQFDNIMPWAGMKRYNIIDNNVISEDEEGFRTDVDTMVYIPEFYFKAEKDTVNSKWRWYVRSTPAPGFALHPGSGRYIGRYHTSEKYMSVSNVMPIGNITFPTARANSHAKGERWWMMDAATWGAVQLLYLVEFADFDAQKTLGVGQNTSVTVNTGATDTARYHTQCINGTASNQYRWIENPFTNTVTMCDGIMLDAEYKLHIGTDNNVFNGTAGVLGDSGVTVPVFSGFKYVGGFGYSEKFPWAFLPDTFVDSAENVPDAWYLSSSARLNGMTVGGSIGVNDKFGMWYADASVRETTGGVRQSARLIYVP